MRTTLAILVLLSLVYSPLLRASEQPDPDQKALTLEQDDPTSRQAWQREVWGVVTPAFRRNVVREGKKHSDKKNAAGPKWVSIGPTDADYQQFEFISGDARDSGRARAILAHPTNPDIVYFLTSGGGLWRTNNWTSTKTDWTPLTDDLPTIGGGSVAFGRNPNTLYLGLGDPFDQVIVGGSMVKSKDGGVNWSPLIELGNAVSVHDVKVDTTTNRDIVLVGTDNGLFRSSDDGSTYDPIATFSGLSVWSIVRTSAGWLASAQPCFINPGFLCGTPTTLFLSTDRGATWAPIANPGNVFSGGRTTFGVGLPGDSNVYAYASTIDELQMKDVYRSSDGGQTWVATGSNATKPLIGGNPSVPNMNICRVQCWYNQMILVDPRDPTRNTLFVGGDLASAVSTNGANTWTLFTYWGPFYFERYAHADHHVAIVKTTGTPTLIFGTDGGLSVSEDNGATFTTDKNRGLATHMYYTVEGHPQFPNLVVGGTQDNGTRIRTDNSTTHNQVNSGDGMGAAFSRDNTNTFFSTLQRGFLRSNLSNTPPTLFQNFERATAGLSDPAGFPFFTAIVPAPLGLDPTGRVFFTFTNSRVWRTNNGLTWTRIASSTASAGVTPSPGLPPGRRFRPWPYNLSISPTDLNRIAVGALSGFLDISTNGGASWTDINLIANVPGYEGFITNTTWQDNQNLWITSVAQNPGAVRVIKASIANPGDSWSTATFSVRQNGLPDLPVTRIVFDPRDATRNTIYAATHVGVYKTSDGGDNWDVFSNGLPNVIVSDIYMPPDGSVMRLATYGRGVWELAQLELASATFADDVTSCDRDGVLDNGEVGRLEITLANQGPNNINQVTLTLTSNNPHVTFPDGNVLHFPPIQKNDVSTDSIRVALNGATGLESADIQIAIASPELGVPPFNVVSSHRLNYDETPQASAIDSVEAENPGWSIAGDSPKFPNVNPWQRRELSTTRHVWWGPDNNGETDGEKPVGPDQQVLVSPAMHVGSAPLVISFQHRFSFEPGGWDGGVIELSTDGGATWTDIGTAAYNGFTNAFTDSPIGFNRRAFVNRIIGYPSFATVTLNLGVAYANRDVKIRFRVGADSAVGAPGWDVDDIAVAGITNTPFTALIGEAAACSR